MKKEDPTRNNPGSLFGLRGKEQRGFILALLIPFIALGLQWELWQYIAPFVWFLFFPAIFISARLGRLKGGLISTVVSTLIVVFFFIPPQLSWEVENPYNLFSVGIFLVMGYLFSDIQERFWVANQHTEEALQAAREANQKITQLYEKTRELDEMKTQFFANVSHELRTPLTLILGPVQKAIQSPQLDSEIRHSLEVVQRNAQLLHRQVNDLLDVSKIDAGHMAIHYSQIDLAQLTRVIASQFSVIADERRIGFNLETKESISAQVDAEKYQRILLNLLSNAFKFTPDGGKVVLELNVEADAAVVQVYDNGPGIPGAQREVVFERFRQLEGNASRKHGGTGLGLSIAKEFVELHRGEIKIEDAPIGGALFKVRIPLSAPNGAFVEPKSIEMNNDISHQLMDELFMERVIVRDTEFADKVDKPLFLVVEDNPDMNMFISNLLAKYYRVSAASNGQSGLEKALTVKPDLILADMMMPFMSGDQMALAIRQHAELKDVPIVMLTAKADEKLRVQLLQESVQDYISKPFTIEELLARVNNLLATRIISAEKLRVSELQYRNLFENMDAGFAYCKMIFEDGHPKDWVYLAVNNAFENLTGLKDAQGKRVNELIPNIREADPELFQIYARVAITGKAEKFETYLESLKMWFSVSVYSPENEHFVAVFDVITERKQADKKLRESEAKFRNIIDLSPIPYALNDENQNITYINAAFTNVFGYDLKDIQTLTDWWSKAYPDPEYRRWVQETWQTRLDKAKTRGTEFEPMEVNIQCKDGSLRTVLVSAGTLIKSFKGIHLVILYDITERKQAEIRLRRFWDLPLVGMAITSPTRHFLEVNQKLETMLGYSAKELTGITWVEVTHPDDIDKNIRLLEQTLAGERDEYTLDKRFIRRDGTLLYTHIAAHCVRRANGTVDYLVLIIQDITESKQAEEALHKTKNLLTDTERIGNVGGWEFNIDTKELTWTEEVYRIHEVDFNHEPTLEKGIDFYTPASKPIIERAVQRASEFGEPYEEELEIITAKGNHRWIQTIGKADLEQRRVFGFFQDITKRKRAEEALRESELFVKDVLNSLTAHIAVLDSQGKIIAVNEAWNGFARENESHDPTAYLGVNYLAVCKAATQQGDPIADQVSQGICTVLDGEQNQFSMEYPCDSPTQQRWFTITVLPRHQPNQGVIVIHQNITERKQAQESLETAHSILKNALDFEKQLARTDPLTGVSNRRYLYELAEYEFEVSARYQRPLSVLMFDIDHFKKVNDTFGHLAGDQILKQVTETARKELRSSDVIGRYGGEEFIILLPETSEEQAYPLAERIRLAVAALITSTDKGNAFVTLSIGIVERDHSSPMESVEEVFRRADKTMYAAKQAGRNRTMMGNK